MFKFINYLIKRKKYKYSDFMESWFYDLDFEESDT